MKKFLSAVSILSISFALCSCANAQNVTKSPQPLIVDGKSVTSDAYNIDGNNYFKIRDIAYYMDFDVSYDDTTNSVVIYPDREYSLDAPKTESTSDISVSSSSQGIYIYNSKINGVKAYNINGANYFKIRDLAREIDFGCIYNNRKNQIELNSEFCYNSADVFGRAKDTDRLKLTFIDVGQGDGILVEFPDNMGEMLIDAGTPDCKDHLLGYLDDEIPDRKLEYIVATHAHADHIGSMRAVLESFDVDKFYAPKLPHTSKTYQNMMATQNAQNAKTYFSIGEVVKISDDVSFKFIAPIRDNYTKDELNNSSTVIMLKYKDKSFLFMGDAERDSEFDLIDSGENLKCDLVKMGHHGSYTSSYRVFCQRVLPQYAVCMLAIDNSYGHPSDIAINNWHGVGARVLATSTLGDIVVTSNGNDIKAYPDEDYKLSEK